MRQYLQKEDKDSMPCEKLPLDTIHHESYGVELKIHLFHTVYITKCVQKTELIFISPKLPLSKYWLETLFLIMYLLLEGQLLSRVNGQLL